MTDKAFINACLAKYGIKGKSESLPGELDFNFLIVSDEGIKYVLKVSRPDYNQEVFDFQEKLLSHLAQFGNGLNFPNLISTIKGETLIFVADSVGRMRAVRMLSWIEGSLWSSICPISDTLLFSLGIEAGKITKTLYEFKHTFSARSFDWNLDNAGWVQDSIHLFSGEQNAILKSFIEQYKKAKPKLSLLRKSVIHNDANDNNILVYSNETEIKVKAIIDYGDAVYSNTINDLAVTVAYAIMGKPDPLRASLPIVQGYHTSFTLLDEEVNHLHLLVAMRLVISVTKSAINREKEPENTYLQISDKSAWELLKKWKNINENYAYYTFRSGLGLNAHPNEDTVKKWLLGQRINLSTLFPTIGLTLTSQPDMGIGSTFLGHRIDFDNNEVFWQKIKEWNKKHPDTIPSNGYMEIRPFYSTETYKKEGNTGPEYRTVHLGTDFWVEAKTPVHCALDGIVHSVKNNNNHKDYGPTVIIKHDFQDGSFFTLYGHLSLSALSVVTNGQFVKKGDLLGYIGDNQENGHWAPHLHFQLILDMMDNTSDFPGVAFPVEQDIWMSICPDPSLLFGFGNDIHKEKNTAEDILNKRKKHLGRSLSISYHNPLHIVRGEGAYLLDTTGRKYIDTVNNVAHVGHEHYRVVKVGIDQMSVLNTNTRYLHENIILFAEKLLSTFPSELCVVHFVNSGSEANELALRMAYTYTGQKDILALDAGYHGNTNNCIDISPYKFNGKGGKGIPANTHIIPLPDTFRGLYRDVNAGLSYANHVYEITSSLNKNGKSPAAFIHESIVSCGGQIELPPLFLERAYKYVRNIGGVCIADEVQTGLGRVGSHWWAFEQYGVLPDIVTIGKPLGNGHPIGAVVCTRAIADSFANGMEFFNTFGGNPVSSAIGNEVINVVIEEGLRQNAEQIGKYLIEELNMVKQKFPIIGDVRGKGLFLGFELTTSDLNPLPEQTSYLSNRMRELGILTSTDGPDNNVIKIKPPLCFSKQNAEDFLIRLQQILRENAMQF